jgi:hypothetical protein
MSKKTSAPKHQVPLAPQMAALSIDPTVKGAYLKRILNEVDWRVARLLADPLRELEDEGPADAVHAVASSLGADEAENKLAAAIPDGATHDPHAWVADAYVPHQTAGLYVGFCLGWRLATARGGKE